MNYSVYHWNLTWAVCGIISALSILIERHKKERSFSVGVFMFMQSAVFGLIGAWNLICLLVKLNVIHP